MDVRFLRGLATSYAAIATKDNKTFYYVTDEKKLYLGDVLLSNEVTLATFNALEERVKALEDAGFQAQIDAINETLKTIATSDTVVAIDNRLKAVEADYLKGADKTELEGKITAHETVVNTKFADYSTTEQMNAAIDADVKVVTDYIAANEAKWSEKTDISGLEQRMTAVEGVADAAQTAQEVSDAIDAKITALDLANTYEAKGAAATAEQNAKDYSDGKLNAVVEQYLTGEGAADTIDTLNEIAQWINNDEAGVAKIIEDVAANTAGVKQNKEDLDKVEAKLNGIADGDGTVKAAIDAALAEAKKYADDNDANTVYDDTALSGRVSALEGKVDVDKVSEAIATATTDMATNASVDGKLEAYAKTADISGDIAKGVEAHGWGNHADAGYLTAHQDISHLATKQEVTDGLALKADKATYEAYVEAHKDDYNNTKIDELVTGATDKAQTAQNEVDALEKVVAANAETCTNNFNTISNQLTWGSF